jgi:hypothetical protein
MDESNEADKLVLKTILDRCRTSISTTGEPVDTKNTPHHVCFYNIYHFGDIYFTQPFVKHVCDANPHITFYYWLTVGQAAYEGIPNLIHLEPISEVTASMITTEKNTLIYSLKNKYSYKKHFDFFYENYPHFVRDFSTFEYRGMSFIAFNTWWSSIFNAEDMDYLFLLAGFKKKMLLLNSIFGLSLNFDFENNKMIPELPLINMPDHFTEWIKTHRNKNTVFIYNYEPRTASFLNKEIMNTTISNIGRTNPHLHIVVPRYDSMFDGLDNIVCCDRDFGFTENRTCTNLLQIEHILQYCRLVVTLPSGSTWAFMNRHISSYRDRTAFYLWGEYAYFAKQLNNWCRYYTGRVDDIIKCVGTNDLEVLVRNFNY